MAQRENLDLLTIVIDVVNSIIFDVRVLTCNKTIRKNVAKWVL